MSIHQVQGETKNGAETFKMQWPLVGTEILVYNQSRELNFQIPKSFLDGAPDLVLYLKDELKIFVKGHITADNQFSIEEVLGGNDYANW